MTVTKRLHQLIGRLSSHEDEIAGWHQVTPEMAKDIHVVMEVLDELATFLEALDRHLPGGDLPEASRASHHSP